jgi:hypothetical protein
MYLHPRQLTSNNKLDNQLKKSRINTCTYKDLSDANPINLDMPTFSLIPNDEIDKIMSPEMALKFQNRKATYAVPITELKKIIANIWQEVIHIKRLDSSYNNFKSNMIQWNADAFTDITNTTNFFSLGGDSLLLVQVCQYYQLLFSLDIEKITIRAFFQYNTIDGHVQILDSIMKDSTQPKQWRPLYIDNGDTLLLIRFFSIIRYSSL